MFSGQCVVKWRVTRVYTCPAVQGVYYGTFPGEPVGRDPTVWAVSRPHNWHPIATEERLLSINTNTGQMINSIRIPSRYVYHSWPGTFTMRM